jgi:putative Ca2+/H+ antiporter (TMEM165/GDT1 family)
MAWTEIDYRLLASTFAAVFVAELGDKTQLATFALSARQSAKLPVFLGAACALVATSAIAVLLGDAVTRLVPAVWLRRAAGVLFLVLGVVWLATSGQTSSGS